VKIFVVRLEVAKLRIRSLGVRITPTQQFPQEQTDVIPATPEGRCPPSRCGRGKSENENNNVLKTQGYHLEPKFGHGQPSLSATMLSLNLWAFRFHPGLEWSDEKYVVRRRKHFWTA
jgi:hypothetical protein